MTADRSGSVKESLSRLVRRSLVEPTSVWPRGTPGEHAVEGTPTSDRFESDGRGAADGRRRSSGPAEVTSPPGRSGGKDRRTFDVRELAEDRGLTEDDPCDDLVRSIVRRAGAGDTIRFRDGRFLLEELHVLERALIVDGEESTLDFGESGGIHFRGSHYNGADPAVTVRAIGAVPRGERTLAVERTAGFEPGDYVLLETGYGGWSSRHPLRAGSGYSCQIARLEEITAGGFALDQPTRTGFEAAPDARNGIEIHRLEPLEAPVFRSLTTVGGAIPLRMESCVGGRFEDCETARYGDYGQRIDYCLGTVYEGSVVTGPRPNDGRHEAIHVAHSTGTTIDRPRVRACRLGIALSNGCFGVDISDPSVSGASVHAIATHDGAAAGGIRIEGGVIESANRAAPPDGSDLSFSNACESVSIRGTAVRTVRTPISADAWELVATDVAIESVDGPDARLGDRPVVVRFGGDEACVSGVLVDGNGRFRSVSDLRGAGRATVDLVRARRPPARQGVDLVSTGLDYLSRTVPDS